jgi:hypothetical protein
MYDSESGRDVRLSFKSLAQNAKSFSAADEQLLKQRIFAAVDELKALGWPIERIIVRIKELAWEVGVRLGHNVSQVDRHPVLAKAVLWCVERFYEDDVSHEARPVSQRS